MANPSTAASPITSIQKAIAVLGTGKMGGILIEAFLKRGIVGAEKVRATVQHASPDRKPIASAKIALGTDNRAAVKGADVVLVCLKPMTVGTVLDEVRDELSADTLVISIAASVTTDYIEKRAGANVPVIRAMPNTPSMVGEGITAICKGKHATQKHVDIARTLFDSVGRTVVVDEKHMDAITGLSGSGPAFLYIILEALAEGGVKMDIIGNRYIPANLNSGNTNHEFDFNNSQNSDDPDGSNPGPPSIYVSGNIGPHQSDPGGNQVLMTSQGDEGGDNGKSVPSGWFRSSPMGGETFPIEADDEGDLDSIMLATLGNSRGVDCTGNWINRRDSNDSRIISQYQNRGNGTFFTSASQPSVAGGTACTESLHDGIPDQWKASQGLSTTDPSLHNQIAPNGYTYLENYMNAATPQ